ncbi:MAG TPA: glycosyltransferase [Blastocatellia bacterium]|nr:glycosyltransferase [Blastocatellia bacterium]
MARAHIGLELTHNGNQVTAPNLPTHTKLDGDGAPTHQKAGETPSAQQEDRSVAVLLDLAADRASSLEWAERELAGASVRVIDKSDLKWKSKREALRRMRSLSPDVFAVFAPDLEVQSARVSLTVFGALCGAGRVVLGDRLGRTVVRSRFGALLIDAPRLAVELAIGYGLLVPISWLATFILFALTALQSTAQRMSGHSSDSVPASPRLRVSVSPPLPVPLTCLFLRATLAASNEGGMATHAAGFMSGASELGHQVKMVTAGAGGSGDRTALKPSRLFTANRALFELWNNLVFTIKTLGLCADATNSLGHFDFIYQRYSRFNWTGVALKIASGRRLALEYNGSEVWVSRWWDPIGQLRLLARFERLNLHAADLIFVVSEVERRNLTAAGVDSAKIIVNPNGVDPERFKPGCGGDEIRRRLGIENKIVVGFLGTFGPWHGAPVLAQAAVRVHDASRFHFLFIGDGDERAMAESIISGSGRQADASFVGRIRHDEAPAYLDACDILVSPHVSSPDGSEFFGSPTKLFEYMSMAKPVVASRLGQIGEVIVDGVNGLLVGAADAEALARTIGGLGSDRELRARLGVAARETIVERHTWRHNAARVFDSALLSL